MDLDVPPTDDMNHHPSNLPPPADVHSGAEGARPDPGSLEDTALGDSEDNSGVPNEGDRVPFREDPSQQPQPEQTQIHLEALKSTQEFIEALRSATIENTQLHPDLLQRLRDPPTCELQIDDPILRQSLETYLEDITEETYERIRVSLIRNHNITLLSHSRIKAKVQEISGVYPIHNDMCIGGCVAFVGPFAKYSRCPRCGENRYDPFALASKGTKKPRQRFVTIPIGPQIQAAYRSSESAVNMRYRANCTRAVIAGLEAGGGITEWADYIHGSSYLEAVMAGDIDENTTVLMGSLDGAQLYRMKASDCWVYIWVSLDRSPDAR